ncbi:lysine-specific demethylase rbr-2 [Ditylenchus destructor]|nr:lysine-specific demethylase rbr-2 [Ditylenchus destructor]
MEQAREINENFCRLIDTPQSYFCLKTVEQLEQQCEKCLFERKSQLHNKVTDLRKRLKNFVERISSMFQKTVGYYNIFDILSGRDDLPTLMEGEPLPLLLFTSTKYTDNWAQLKLFNTNALLTNHLTALAEQQANLLMALRLANEKRPLKETCSCGRDVVPKTSNESIPCFLCNASFHVSCAQWEVFFDRMPPGVYLCPRCLRGRRPCIEDVEAACESAPRNSLEHILVQNLLNRSVKAFSRLQKAISSITVNSELVAISQEQKNRIQETLIVALSVEVMDTEAYQMAFAVYFKLFPLPEQQIERWRQIQARMVEAKSSPIIFPPPSPSNGSVNVGSHRRSNGKRSSSSALLTPRNEQKLDSHGSAGKKRCKDVYHADQEYCAADKCLRPYSDQVRWIQCDSGCARWYHYVCVGQTVKAAEQISIYSCYRCSITSTAAACTTTT